ncbi:DUF3298 and DUF4163 domain-containing protein [Pseudomonas matsuisoli]|uniref:DUF3298 domain-containing protein n=1 Tax=Pseudomonas matsuisoli TaxID=1515666 RepID=A0A917V1X4_9PSED|nr:DUF3298 and DUF4163 domain-containing protein [Pseudomonas matsuisoli]GGK10605.1 DUF3298 domain-containing protein [Pseudomonas matsuisoli]
MISKKLAKLISTSTLALALAACQSQTLLPKRGAEYQSVKWEHQQPGCESADCPAVNVDTLRFLTERELNPIIEQRLLEFTRAQDDAPMVDSLQAYEDAFLQQAEPGWMSYLQAKVREQDDQIILIELSSYLFTGGAHGMPGRGFINYDVKAKRVLALDDMIIPGMENAFWEKARQAHQRWLKHEGLEENTEYLEMWPFQQTENVALGQKAVYLKYDVYAIAPYAAGHPELTIPYSELKGVLRPEFLR